MSELGVKYVSYKILARMDVFLLRENNDNYQRKQIKHK